MFYNIFMVAGKELAEHSPLAEYGHVLELLDIKVVFNSHGTAEHARATASVIKPNSLVFWKG